MKLHLDTGAGALRFTAYGTGFVNINGQRVDRSLIVTPQSLHQDWRPRSVEDLRREDLQPLIDLEPEVVLLGTGARQQFPDARLLLPLYQLHIGTEVMDTSAACRTFNIIASEGRRVAAALML